MSRQVTGTLAAYYTRKGLPSPQDNIARIRHEDGREVEYLIHPNAGGWITDVGKTVACTVKWRLVGMDRIVKLTTSTEQAGE